MIKKAIRTANNERVFDVIIDGENVKLEVKDGKRRKLIGWGDVVNQIEKIKKR